MQTHSSPITGLWQYLQFPHLLPLSPYTAACWQWHQKHRKVVIPAILEVHYMFSILAFIALPNTVFPVKSIYITVCCKGIRSIPELHFIRLISFCFVLKTAFNSQMLWATCPIAIFQNQFKFLLTVTRSHHLNQSKERLGENKVEKCTYLSFLSRDSALNQKIGCSYANVN